MQVVVAAKTDLTVPVWSYRLLKLQSSFNRAILGQRQRRSWSTDLGRYHAEGLTVSVRGWEGHCMPVEQHGASCLTRHYLGSAKPCRDATGWACRWQLREMLTQTVVLRLALWQRRFLVRLIAIIISATHLRTHCDTSAFECLAHDTTYLGGPTKPQVGCYNISSRKQVSRLAEYSFTYDNTDWRKFVPSGFPTLGSLLNTQVGVNADPSQRL